MEPDMEGCDENNIPLVRNDLVVDSDRVQAQVVDAGDGGWVRLKTSLPTYLPTYLSTYYFLCVKDSNIYCSACLFWYNVKFRTIRISIFQSE